MKRDDVLDPARWRQMLWRGAAGLDLDDDPPAVEAPDDPPAAGLLESPDLLDLHVEWIDEVWRERDPTKRRTEAAAITDKLLAGLRLTALSHRHPRAAVRLVRLLVEVWPSIGQEEGRRRGMALTLARLDHPELGDLLVEVADLGDRSLTFAVELSLGDRDDLEALDPHLGQKLAALLERAATWRSREIALVWLSRGRWPEAVAWWRKALRWHHLRSRYAALGALLERPGALAPADVAWLVEDLVVHPVPDETSADSDLASSYERALLDAVRRAPSPALGAPLERIIAGDAAFIGSDRTWFDQGWAMAALASVDPDRAREHAEINARRGEMHHRVDAVRAYRALPAAVAQAPLQALAADVDATVARAAAEAWTAHFGTPCPVDPLAGVAAHLLDAPPSAEWSARIAVFRAKGDARAALLRAVMREPPTREALVLTLYGRRANPYLHARGIPADEGAWVRWLLRRHGRIAYDAVLWEAADAPGGERWLFELGLMARAGGLPRARRAAVAEAALRELLRATIDDSYATLTALKHAGPSWEGVERYWSLLLHGPYNVMTEAVEVLAALGPDASLDRRTEAAFAATRAEGDWSRVARVGAVGIARRVAPVIAQIEADVWNLDDPAASEALGVLLERLRSAGLVPEQRVVDALGDPAAVRFVRYADHPKVRDRLLRAAVVDRLRAALDSPARSGASAAIAAVALLRCGVMRVGDRRVDAVCARAPAAEQLDILNARWALVYRKQGRSPLDPRAQPLIEALLCHPDAAIGKQCVEFLHMSEAVDQEWLGGVYDTLPPGPVRELLRYLVDRPSEAECYWLGDPEEDDE